MADNSGADELSNETCACIPRHTPSNPYNYTNVQLAERKKALKELAEIYPSLPFAWIEMAYDFEKNTPYEDIQSIINEKKWETPGKFTPGNKKLNEN